ncbi:MAG TPA: hypothetical protein DCX53_02295 [Anaerolineae bacterium]|nr:hypothetical protein [Anaerolineae bacterium]
MKKFLVPIILLTVISGACLPLAAPVDSAPQVDSQATLDSIVKTSEVQTLAALPSPTVAPVTPTEASIVEPTRTLEVFEAPSSSPIPNLTTTPATATLGTENPTSQPVTTGTQATSSSGTITLTPTLGILTYGTLPPAVPSAGITLINKSRVQAYISLQNYPPDRPAAILEYPVKKQVNVSAPLGYYIYVVWVGGRQINGEFTLHKNDDLTITIYKDKVVIQ